MPLDDARTSPLGLGLSLQQWRSHPAVRQLAARRGFKISAPNYVALEATPATAIVNHGILKAWCPDCVGAAEDVWRNGPFFCMRCGNASIGGAWRPVAWPPDLAEIEARLDGLARERQNWDPWSDEPSAEDEAAWVEQARVMLDPSEGRRDA